MNTGRRIPLITLFRYKKITLPAAASSSHSTSHSSFADTVVDSIHLCFLLRVNSATTNFRSGNFRANTTRIYVETFHESISNKKIINVHEATNLQNLRFVSVP